MVERCGNCRHTQPNQDISLVDCYGVPPQPVVMPTKQGLALNFVRPTLSRKERACGLWAAKELADVVADVPLSQ